MKTTFIVIFVSIVLVAGIIAVTAGDEAPSVTNASSALETADGKQLVEIKAKGGYSPRSTVVKAGVPTILRVKTSGTYDCSSVFTIPSLNYRRNLPPTGNTDVEIAPQKPGSVLRGTCGMGMYNFEVRFD